MTNWPLDTPECLHNKLRDGDCTADKISEPPHMPSRIALEDLHRRPGFLLKRCHQVSMAIFVDGCRAFGMTPSQFGCLSALAECPDIDQLTLGRLLGFDRSTVGLVVRILHGRGLIERVVDRRDKRRLRLRLSRRGAALLRSSAGAASRVRERVLAGLPRAARAQFIALLEAFLEGHQAVIPVDEILAEDAPPSVRKESTRARSRRKPASRPASALSRPRLRAT